MKSEEQIKNQIGELRRNGGEYAEAKIHALEWVIGDQRDIYKDDRTNSFVGVPTSWPKEGSDASNNGK